VVSRWTRVVGAYRCFRVPRGLHGVRGHHGQERDTAFGHLSRKATAWAVLGRGQARPARQEGVRGDPRLPRRPPPAGPGVALRARAGRTSGWSVRGEESCTTRAQPKGRSKSAAMGLREAPTGQQPSLGRGGVGLGKGSSGSEEGLGAGREMDRMPGQYQSLGPHGAVLRSRLMCSAAPRMPRSRFVTRASNRAWLAVSGVRCVPRPATANSEPFGAAVLPEVVG